MLAEQPERYVLHFDVERSMFVAFKIYGGTIRPVSINDDLDKLVDECEAQGLKVDGLTQAAEQELYHFITVSQVVEDFLKLKYPAHFDSATPIKRALGFDPDR